MTTRLALAAGLLLIVLGSSGASVHVLSAPATPTAVASSPSMYYGAYAPQDSESLGTLQGLLSFERKAKKAVSLVEGYQHWADPNPDFPTAWMNTMRKHGAIPYLTWLSETISVKELTAKGNPDEADYALKNIYDSKHNKNLYNKYRAYITRWARDAKAWGHPFFLRLDHEMNSPREPYAAEANGNAIDDFVKTWRYIHDIFTRVGAKNVTWVWCVSVYYHVRHFVTLSELHEIYPGNSYVDWVGIDGYNFGNNPLVGSPWQSFSQVFLPTYNAVHALAPSKPMILETGSVESCLYRPCATEQPGLSKAAWITDAYTTQLPSHFSAVRGIVWFNYNDWVIGQYNKIDTSKAALAAFQAAVASPIYASNRYAGLRTSPIPVP